MTTPFLDISTPPSLEETFQIVGSSTAEFHAMAAHRTVSVDPDTSQAPEHAEMLAVAEALRGANPGTCEQILRLCIIHTLLPDNSKNHALLVSRLRCYGRLADFLFDNGRWDEAREQYVEALDMWSDYISWMMHVPLECELEIGVLLDRENLCRDAKWLCERQDRDLESDVKWMDEPDEVADALIKDALTRASQIELVPVS